MRSQTSLWVFHSAKYCCVCRFVLYTHMLRHGRPIGGRSKDGETNRNATSNSLAAIVDCLFTAKEVFPSVRRLEWRDGGTEGVNLKRRSRRRVGDSSQISGHYCLLFGWIDSFWFSLWERCSDLLPVRLTAVASYDRWRGSERIFLAGVWDIFFVLWDCSGRTTHWRLGHCCNAKGSHPHQLCPGVKFWSHE